MYCKLPTNGKQLPAFPLTAMTGIEPRPQRWEARVLPLCHRGPSYSMWTPTLLKGWIRPCISVSLPVGISDYTQNYSTRLSVNLGPDQESKWINFWEDPNHTFVTKKKISNIFNSPRLLQIIRNGAVLGLAKGRNDWILGKVWFILSHC